MRRLTTALLALFICASATVFADQWGLFQAFTASPKGIFNKSIRTVKFGDFPGTSGAYIRTADSVANSNTADLDIRIRLSLPDWTPVARRTIAGKYNGGLAQRSWVLWLNTNGTLRLQIHNPGSNSTGVATGLSTVSVPFPDGATGWIRVTFLGDNGAGAWVVNFYTGPDGINWTLLGVASSGTPNATAFDANIPLELGSYEAGTGELLVGKIYRFQYLSSINGTLVNDFDPSKYTTGSSFVSGTGETWTILGTASVHQ